MAQYYKILVTYVCLEACIVASIKLSYNIFLRVSEQMKFQTPISFGYMYLLFCYAIREKTNPKVDHVGFQEPLILYMYIRVKSDRI